MRIVVLSDSHKAKGNLFEIVEKHMDTADLFVFLGDVDDDFDDVLMLYPDLKYERVAGNNDWYSEHQLQKILYLNGKRVLICHGHTYHVKSGLLEITQKCRAAGIDLCLYGHTHVQYSNYNNGLYILNPGSVRSGDYAMVDIIDSGIVIIHSRV